MTDHELELIKKREFARGYQSGQRSMDAGRYAVKLRLRRLDFDGGSHENLHKIAYAVYPCATGWTCESAAGLRDELIRLLGGCVGDGPDQIEWLVTQHTLGNIDAQQLIERLREIM